MAAGWGAVYRNRWALKDELRSKSTSNADLRAIRDELRKDIRANGGAGGRELLRCVVNSIIVERQFHLNETHSNEASMNKDVDELLVELHGKSLNYPDLSADEVEAKRRQWCRLSGSGSPTAVEVERDSTSGLVTKVQYGDHVTRMLAAQQGVEERKHMFTIPDLGDRQKFVRIKLSDLAEEEDMTYANATSSLAPEDLKVFQQTLERFSFERYEDKKQGYKPIAIEAPMSFDGRSFNQDTRGNFLTDSNVLHLPVKLTTDIVDMLNAEGRRLPDGEKFSDEEAYLPEALARSSDVVRLVKQALTLEQKLNPVRLRKNFLLLSLRVAVLEGGQSLGQGGWHSDGAQGCERIQMDGLKTPIDRAYTISSALPTSVTDLRLNLEAHRRLAAKKGLTLDQFNVQDIIQKTVDQAESHARLLGKTIVKYAAPNVVEYLNPTMLHAAQTFIGPPGDRAKRSFMRILFSEVPRDRLGDTVNPIFGPIYALKIKVLTDIYELPWNATQFAYTHPDIPSTMSTPEAILRQRSQMRMQVEEEDLDLEASEDM